MEKNKVRTVTDIQRIPEGFVVLSEFGKENYQMLRKALDKGSLLNVKWLYGRSGIFFVDKKQAEELINKEKARNSGGVFSKDGGMSNYFESVGKKYIQNDLLASINKNLSSMNKKIEAVFDEEMAGSKQILEFADVFHRRMQAILDRIENLDRHVCIQWTLLYGLVKSLGVENEVLDKSKAKERIKMINRLLSREDWNFGFESEPAHSPE